MTVPYTKWLTISRGSKTEKSPAFSSLVKLSASGEDVGFIDEPAAVTDRYAVLTPLHHPFCCNALLEFVAWPYCYRRFNQGLTFRTASWSTSYSLRQTLPSWMSLSRCSDRSTTASWRKRSCWSVGGVMAFKDQMLDKMFPRS